MTAPATVAATPTLISVVAGGVDDPAYLAPSYVRQSPRWDVLDDVMEGTDALRGKGETYLPRAPGESKEKYDRRLNRSRFYNFYRRTHKALVGRVMRVPPKLVGPTSDTAPPPDLVAHAENIDGQGAHFAIFARRLLGAGLHYGFAGVLVDAPPDPTPALGRRPTLADERALGIRPYWVEYNARQVLSFRTAVIGGVRRLTQLVLYDGVEEEAGTYGVRAVQRYRVLTRQPNGPPSFVVWQREITAPGTAAVDVTDRGTTRYRVIEAGTYRNQREIPFAPFYADDPADWFLCRPSLLDLAELNLDHYAVQSDHRHSMHVASVPVAVFKGRDTTQKVQAWGVEQGIDIGIDGDAFFLEHEGKALGQTREELRDLEYRMGVLALSQLARRTNQAETAEAKRIDGMEQESALAVAARGLRDCLEQAWGFHAAYLGAPAPRVTVNTDFDGLSLSDAQHRELRESWLAGAYSLDTFLDMLELGGMLPEGFDRENDRERVEEEAAGRLALVPGAGADLNDEDAVPEDDPAGPAGGGNGGATPEPEADA